MAELAGKCAYFWNSKHFFGHLGLASLLKTAVINFILEYCRSQEERGSPEGACRFQLPPKEEEEMAEALLSEGESLACQGFKDILYG